MNFNKLISCKLRINFLNLYIVKRANPGRGNRGQTNFNQKIYDQLGNYSSSGKQELLGVGTIPKGEQRFFQSSENNSVPKGPPNPGKGTL